MKATWLKGLFLSVALLAASGAQAVLVDGKDFKRLDKPQAVEVPGKLEVIEFFWYGCGHCFAIEPHVATWAKSLPADVNFRRVHVWWPGRPDIDAHAKIFVALQTMGIDAKYQQAVFDAVQRDRIELRRDDVMNDWLKKQGIDQAKFRAGYGSFSSNMMMKKLEKLAQQYNVDGVPLFFVNGKYMTSPAMVGKEDATITRVIDELLAQERKLAAPTGKKAKK